MFLSEDFSGLIFKTPLSLFRFMGKGWSLAYDGKFRKTQQPIRLPYQFSMVNYIPADNE
jgi:hypothetical protein